MTTSAGLRPLAKGFIETDQSKAIAHIAREDPGHSFLAAFLANIDGFDMTLDIVSAREI